VENSRKIFQSTSFCDLPWDIIKGYNDFTVLNSRSDSR